MKGRCRLAISKIGIYLLIASLFMFSGWIYAAEANSVEEQNTSDDFFLPLVLYGSETGVMAGFIYMKFPQSASSAWQTTLMVTEKEQFLGSVGMQRSFAAGNYLLQSSISFCDWPSIFWGIGDKAPSGGEEDYALEKRQVTASFFKKLGTNFYLGPTFDAAWFSISDLEAGGELAQKKILGSEGADTIGLGLHFRHDRRDGARHGQAFEVKALFYEENLGSSEDFQQFNVDYTRLVPVGERATLAVNGRLTLSDGDVPFQMLPSLGSDRIMRGIEKDRYRDRHFLAIQGEYRFPIVGRWSGVGFVALGDVADHIADLDFEKFSGGGGVRYALEANGWLKLRLDVGISEDGANAYFGLQEAF